MKKIVSQHQRDECARRKAMGIAVIQRPLRYIANRPNKHSVDFKHARMAADNGRGDIVMRIARRLPS